jgi:predicted transposase YdaD
MIDTIANPHDAFFKQYLSQPAVAVDFLRQHLPAEVAVLLDLTQLQMEKDSFVDERLRGYFSDLIYSTVTREQTPIRIALLCEHKSYPDPWVTFQVLRYQVGYWVQEFDRLQAPPPPERNRVRAYHARPPRRRGDAIAGPQRERSAARHDGVRAAEAAKIGA